MSTHVDTSVIGPLDVPILARTLSNVRDELSPDVARVVLEAGFSDQDKARMHDLAVRNQSGKLTATEREELLAFGRVGDVLAILKSKARRTLGVKLKKPRPS